MIIHRWTDIFAVKLRCGEMVASEEVVQERDVGWLPGVASDLSSRIGQCETRLLGPPTKSHTATFLEVVCLSTSASALGCSSLVLLIQYVKARIAIAVAD
jgi:hypothetical protein